MIVYREQEVIEIIKNATALLGREITEQEAKKAVETYTQEVTTEFPHYSWVVIRG